MVRGRRIGVATVVMLIGLTGTPLMLAGTPAVAKHVEGHGRLSASSGSGGFIASAPERRPYWISVGDWRLCDTARDAGSPTDEITVTGVRYVMGRREPLEVRAYLRRVTPHQVAAHPRADPGNYGPFISALGRPPGFIERYARWAYPGTYTRAVTGTRVARGCDETEADALADWRGEIPDHSWLSLVLAVKVGADGARVRRTLIDYTVGTTSRTLRINWTVGGQGYRHAD